MLLYIKYYNESWSRKQFRGIILCTIYLTLCFYNFIFEMAIILRPAYKNNTTIIRKNSIESLEDYRMRDSFRYITNYIKRNPGSDIFFKKCVLCYILHTIKQK